MALARSASIPASVEMSIPSYTVPKMETVTPFSSICRATSAPYTGTPFTSWLKRTCFRPGISVSSRSRRTSS